MPLEMERSSTKEIFHPTREAILMPMYKKSLLILLFIALAAAGGALYGCYSQEEAVPLDAAERVPAQPDAGTAMTVYVTGAVNRPGIVEVPADARVADAVNACGGVLPTADLDAINMAQKLKDGQQVRVPEKNSAPPPSGTRSAGTTGPPAAGKSGTEGKSAAAPAGGLVNINTADEQTLDSLPGIGPAMAKRIIEYRNTEGMFQSPEDLKKIKGIGNAKFEKLKDRITV